MAIEPPFADEPVSARLSSLCCFLLDGLLDFTVLDEDLEELGAFSVPARESMLGPEAWARIVALRWIRESPDRERQLADRLDLRYADLILHARQESSEALRELTLARAECLSPVELPGWLYALATDPRSEVQRLASALVVRIQRELHHRWRVRGEAGSAELSS